jgi:predicted enzyme related to lactoylglutathione lyase
MNEQSKGRFIWHELVTSDTKSAAAFYSSVARLKTQPAPSDAGYTMFLGSGQPMGGLLDTATMGGSSRWLSFIVTTDVDETARQTESLHGAIVKAPMDIPSGGRAAILQDPQGAVFAVWSSNKPTQQPPDVPLGGMSWHELATTDHAAAFSFYQRLFGWHTTSSMDMGPQGEYRMFGPAGAKEPFGGMYTKAAGSPGGPNWLPYIKVADARPATATAKKSGAQILHGPAPVPGGGWITMGIDPQGAMFAVHSVASAAPAKAKTKRAANKKSAPGRKAAAPPKRKTAKAAKKKKAAPRRAKKKAGSKK